MTDTPAPPVVREMKLPVDGDGQPIPVGSVCWEPGYIAKNSRAYSIKRFEVIAVGTDFVVKYSSVGRRDSVASHEVFLDLSSAVSHAEAQLAEHGAGIEGAKHE